MVGLRQAEFENDRKISRVLEFSERKFPANKQICSLPACQYVQTQFVSQVRQGTVDSSQRNSSESGNQLKEAFREKTNILILIKSKKWNIILSYFLKPCLYWKTELKWPKNASFFFVLNLHSGPSVDYWRLLLDGFIMEYLQKAFLCSL